LKKEDIFAYEFAGDRYDAGDRLGFLKANVAFALKRQGIKGEFRKFLKGLSI
ncbi:MAG: UTP--glucose-1-phosphate uridylyltransferase, partial [Deltaproteobacteria bacterium]|nr:UTP--glucose-1-phosphate uridylyltransferase [Deltaproteobacteria bacterium]